MINHCDRHITLLSDTDIFLALFNLFTPIDILTLFKSMIPYLRAGVSVSHGGTLFKSMIPYLRVEVSVSHGGTLF
jgi:hypothetical protein